MWPKFILKLTLLALPIIMVFVENKGKKYEKTLQDNNSNMEQHKSRRV